ncbi:MAG TPA: holin [Clostridiales bacterium]|nr:holin [Clostridiales bacterium]
MEQQSRWRSKVVWVAMLALIYFVLKEWIGFEIPKWDIFVTLLLGVLTGFGILNNPTNKSGF